MDTDRERWQGNLYGAWESIFSRLIRGLPTPFRLRGPYRVDEPEGLETLREAFVNLLVHTDYKETRDAVIEHRDDRYVFRNPGDSWVTVENLGVEGRSERRNPVIAQLFDDLGVADQAGSGYLRIYDEWLALGYRKPSVLSDPLRYEFQLDLSLASMLSYQEREWLSSLGGPWQPKEEIALIYARHQGVVDNQTLRSATGQGVLEASRTLTSLRDRGHLRSKGSGKNAFYRLSSSTDQSDDSGELISGANALTPQASDLTPQANALTPQANTLATDMEGLRQQIAFPIASGQRSKPDLVKRAILLLCDTGPLSMSELTTYLKRDRYTIRRYVRELIDMGGIIPARSPVNHPDQTYTSSEGWRSMLSEWDRP